MYIRLCLLLCLAFSQKTAFAQAAHIDASFGNNGYVLSSFGGGSISPYMSDLLLLPDGKLLGRFIQGIDNNTKQQLALYRFSADGALDSTFADHGILRLFETANTIWHFNERQLLIDGDGRILTFANAFGTGKTEVFQFDPNGSPDPNFGNNGKLVINEGGSNLPVPANILRKSDGNLVLTYQSALSTFQNVGFRYVNANGTLPPNSQIKWYVTPNTDEEMLQSMLLPNDHLLFCGSIKNKNANGDDLDLFLAQFDVLGNPVANFGNNGLLRMDISGKYDYGLQVQVLPNGKIQCTGTAEESAFIARFHGDGAPDSSFWSVGYRIYALDVFAGVPAETALTPLTTDNKFVLATNLNYTEGAVVRLLENGEIDTTLNGVEPLKLNTASDSLRFSPLGVLALPDGRIVVAGTTYGVKSLFFMLRLLPEANATAWHPDQDQDGVGSDDNVIFSANPPANYLPEGGDCNDMDANINPNAEEICNQMDDNCDGLVDEIPSVSCAPPVVLPLDGTGQAQLFLDDVYVLDPDLPCSGNIVSFNLDKTLFNCTDIGPAQPVTLTATSNLGGTKQCQTEVSVVDTTPPGAFCKGNLTVLLDDTGLYALSPSEINAGSTDNCSIAQILLEPAQFTEADLGPNSVTLTVVDAAGNQQSCTATVIVTQIVGAFEQLGQSSVQIMPNPVSDRFFVKIFNQSDLGGLRLELLDAQGRVLVREFQTVSKNLISVDARNLAAGVYFLRMELGGVGFSGQLERL